MFESITKGLTGALESLRRQTKLTESNIAESLGQVRQALLEADVAYDVAKAFTDRVTEAAIGRQVLNSINPGQQLVGVVYERRHTRMIAEIAERQGYPMWELEVDGKTLHHLVEVNNRIIADPDYVTKYSGVSEVSLRYRDDRQYFAWFEMYLARFENEEMEAWIADRRPLYNRSLGGHMTAYFYEPD